MSSEQKIFFIFDMTRNRSHLFFRYLGTHPDVQDVWHPFLPAYLFGPERMALRRINSELVPPMGNETYAGCTSRFLQAIKEAQDQGKIVVANEHIQIAYDQEIHLNIIRNKPVDIPTWSNPTVIPDDIFNGLTPLFVIRHPVHAIQSNYTAFRDASDLRPGREDWKSTTTMSMQRRVFDLFRERNNGKAPVVVDGDDVVWREPELRVALAGALGLDPKGLSTTWEVTPQEKRSQYPVIQRLLSNIYDSTGVEVRSEKRPEANMEKAYSRWVAEYGQELADQLRATAEQNLPHYEYMVQFKL